MAWLVEFHDEFYEEYRDFAPEVQKKIAKNAKLLEEHGPTLPRPYADTVTNSTYKNMKELRCTINSREWRILFAFDPDRKAILLSGGDKGKDEKGFYDEAISIADRRFQEHLDQRSAS